MKNIHSRNSRSGFLSHSIIFSLLVLALVSCQDVIQIDVPQGPTQLSVDGRITNQATAQTIRLSESAPYFDNSPAKPVLGATVSVTDERGKVFSFKDLKNNGYYVWQPASARDTLGRIGGVYSLLIKSGSDEYVAKTKINRVPKIDSVTYFAEKPPVAPQNGPKEGYIAEFFGRDPVGEGDCYWIKSAKNSKLFSKADQIQLAYDAGFSPGAATDGLRFILPIRRSISRELFSEKDTVKVELHSITLENYFFLFQVQQESQNGGIFATPPANIPTNVINRNPNGRKAVGFFGGSAVSLFQTVVVKEKAKEKNA